MKTRCLVAWLLLFPALAQGSVEVTDDLGDTVTLEAPAQRIVSLAPHATELLFSVGAGTRIVGAVNYSDHPPEARDIPRVGGYNAVDFERIVELAPDLVIAWHSGNGRETASTLRALGLTVYQSEPRRLDDIPDAMAAFGALTGNRARAREAAAAFREQADALRARYGDRGRVGVFYQIWKQPLMTVNDDHLISDVIRLCGGNNVFGALGALVPRLSREAVIARDPEAIVASGMDASRPAWLDDWQRWPAMTAVRRDNLFHVDPDHMQRHSPRVLLGAARLCEHLETARQRRESAP